MLHRGKLVIALLSIEQKQPNLAELYSLRMRINPVSGRDEWTYIPLLSVKFNLDRYNVSPLLGKKPKNNQPE